MKKIQIAAVLILILILSACNLPESSNPTQASGAAYTQAAQTVQAELTQVAGLASATPNIPPATLTPVPSNTPVPSATVSPLPCNAAVFITDVTVPDNTVIPAGGAFTKTWRLRNVGTCTWNSTYQLVFVSGDALGVPAGYAQALTSGFVSPGQDLDATVNLTAPMAGGTYTGRWAFRDSGGALFTYFIVKIQVPAATSHSVTVNYVSAEGGFVQSDGTVNGNPNTGDSAANLGFEAFVSFDISAIPASATITQVQMDLTHFDVLGNPFSALGCLKAYPTTFATPVGAAAFVAFPAPGGEDHDWCSSAELGMLTIDNDFKNDLQARVGSSRLQYRLQFGPATNGDGVADAVRFSNIKLNVTYTTP
jgi:hypothetical protein